MRLAAFIRKHRDEIVGEFIDFARTLAPAALDSSEAELRDHAHGILLSIAADLGSHETAEQREQKSVGQVSEVVNQGTAACAHGAQRQAGGFTLPQLTAEYRALRASVMRLWLPTITTYTSTTVDDLARFHEGVDQALQESAIQYAQRASRTRDTFLAMLGHDLRSPLATMSMAGMILAREGVGDERTRQLGCRIRRSARSMTTMVNDLLEYARSELGGEMPLLLALGDLGDICRSAVDEAALAHPDCTVEMNCQDQLIGDFDSARLAQVFSNLLNNAAQYRSDSRPVTLEASMVEQQFLVTVTNFGREIPPESLRAIFDPLVQLSVSASQKGRASTSLGLGLFIAREITQAHGGSIDVLSDASSGTVFTVRLPLVLSYEG